MKELKIIHQNINQKNHVKEIPTCVVENLLKVAIEKTADVIICTEFKMKENYKEVFKEPFKKAGYKVYKNTELNLAAKGKVNMINQVLIAVKKEIIESQNYVVEPIEMDQNYKKYLSIDELNYKNIGETPNYLRIDLKINNRLFSLIGVRIRTLKSGGPNERIFRAKQFEKLLTELPKDREIIMLGDFNVSPHKDFMKDNQNNPWHYEKSYIKKLNDSGLLCKIPKVGFSPFKSKWKLDHVIVSNNLKLGNPIYITGYSEGPNFKNKPDHEILFADIKLSVDIPQKELENEDNN